MRWTDPIKDLLHIIFPSHCCCCNELLVGDEHDICLHCLLSLPYTHTAAIEDNPTEMMFKGRFRCEAATALLAFKQDNLTQKIVHNIKYYGQQRLGISMGCLIGNTLQASGRYNDIDIIIPVPLHKKKEQKRGYNQSDLLCKGINELLKKEISIGNLTRVVDTESQTHKSPEERIENMDGVFKVRHPEEFRGKHLLIVDDVITTGATISGCCYELEKIPGVRISIAALAKA